MPLCAGCTSMRAPRATIASLGRLKCAFTARPPLDLRLLPPDFDALRSELGSSVAVRVEGREELEALLTTQQAHLLLLALQL